MIMTSLIPKVGTTRIARVVTLTAVSPKLSVSLNTKLGAVQPADRIIESTMSALIG